MRLGGNHRGEALLREALGRQPQRKGKGAFVPRPPARSAAGGGRLVRKTRQLNIKVVAFGQGTKRCREACFMLRSSS